MSPNFLLYTDGSGHPDGYGGSAALAYDANASLLFRHVVASYATDVDRAELEALLLGLQGIFKYTSARRDDLLKSPIRVAWFCDRESLVGCVATDANGRPFFARHAQPDLWLRFAWYEPMFTIDPHHIARGRDPNNILCDALAGDARRLIKDHLTLPEATPATDGLAHASAQKRLTQPS